MSTCKRGHVGAERYPSSGACKQCQTELVRTPEYRERTRKLNRARYPGMRDSLLAQQRGYRATPRGRALQIMQGVVARSRKRGTPVEITPEWIEARLEAGVCEISGLAFRLDEKSVKGPFAPSLDRIDNSLGYSPSNCRMILWALNTAFSWWDEEQTREIMLAWLGSSNAARNIAMLGSRRLTSVCGNEPSRKARHERRLADRL